LNDVVYVRKLASINKTKHLRIRTLGNPSYIFPGSPDRNHLIYTPDTTWVSQ